MKVHTNRNHSIEKACSKKKSGQAADAAAIRGGVAKQAGIHPYHCGVGRK